MNLAYETLIEATQSTPQWYESIFDDQSTKGAFLLQNPKYSVKKYGSSKSLSKIQNDSKNGLLSTVCYVKISILFYVMPVVNVHFQSFVKKDCGS